MLVEKDEIETDGRTAERLSWVIKYRYPWKEQTTESPTKANSFSNGSLLSITLMSLSSRKDEYITSSVCKILTCFFPSALEPLKILVNPSGDRLITSSCNLHGGRSTLRRELEAVTVPG
uniref:Uncharacterized protein n=1 Tax=Arundo donax TaxID=35708 RepID=A0A0A9DP24_ARUDO